MTRSILNRFTFSVALGGALGAVACSASDEPTTAQATQALSASDHFYLRCNTTGWNVDDATRLVPVTVDGQLRELEFEVTQPWMVTNGDSCIVTATNQLNGWGTQTTEFGITSSPLVVPGGTQLITWGGHFRIQFPELGTYRAQLNAANGSFSVGAPGDSEPEPELSHRGAAE